jgi:hypothetical protein
MSARHAPTRSGNSKERESIGYFISTLDHVILETGSEVAAVGLLGRGRGGGRSSNRRGLSFTINRRVDQDNHERTLEGEMNNRGTKFVLKTSLRASNPSASQLSL